MGAFEFDLSARNCDCNNNHNSSSSSGKGETCIIAQKIFDQCRIQKCLTSDILGPARAARGNGNSCNDMLCEGDIIIPPCNAADVSIRDLELERIEILRKKPNPLQEGCWDLELKYVFNYTLEFRRADGCFIGCIPATNSYNLRVTLFGSTEADVTTATDLYDCCGNSNGGPFAIAEGKAVALQADLRYPSSCCDPCHNHHHNSCECNAITVSNGDAAMGAPVAVNVSIGLFTIVKLFRTVNMVVNSLGRCMPETCTNTAVPGDPCRNFENIRFPLDMFSPSTEPKSCCGFGPIFGSPNCEADCLGCGCNGNNGNNNNCDNNCDWNNNGCNCGCR